MLIALTVGVYLIIIILWRQYNEHGRAFYKLHFQLDILGTNQKEQMELLEEMKKETLYELESINNSLYYQGVLSNNEKGKEMLYDHDLGRTQDD